MSGTGGIWVRDPDGGPKPIEVTVGRQWTLNLLAPDEWITSNKINGSWDRYKTARLTKAWRSASRSACANGALPHGLRRLDMIRIVAVARFRGRAPVRDRNNLEPTLKAVVDGLTPERTIHRKGRTIDVPGWGLIPDDSDKHVESARISIGDPLPPSVVQGHPGFLIVTITELVRADALFTL
jgi:hypothetical protein